jgi:hypothetical protein
MTSEYAGVFYTLFFCIESVYFKRTYHKYLIIRVINELVSLKKQMEENKVAFLRKIKKVL